MAVGGDEGFHIADAYVEIHADKDALKRDLATLGADIGPEAEKGGKDAGKRLGKGLSDGADGKGVGKKVGDDVDSTLGPRASKSGKDSGDKLSKGMSLAIVRNSPLIVAGIAGALAAGAPVAIAGASALFIGIGAVAAAQSQRVRQQWAGAFDEIKRGAENDASVLVPVLSRMASRVSDEFTRLRPTMVSAFTDVAPEVDNMTTSLMKAADDGVGGLATAVSRSKPVMDGLDSLIEHVGSGLGQFFTIISSNSSHAGQSFAALGSIIESLLVILGQLLSTGSTLSAVVLPSLATVLRIVAGALQLMAPVLPLIVSGLTALKVAQSVGGWMKAAGDEVGNFQKRVQGAAGAVPGLTGALPAIGAGLVLLASAYAAADQQEQAWARSLLDGGNAADRASAQIRQASAFAQEFGTGLTGVIGRLTGYGAALDTAGNAQKNTEQKARELYAAMSPLEQKQQDVTKATNELQEAVQKYGSGSAQAIGASVDLKAKQEALTRAQEELDRATHGVTEAMIQQANQALAMADSNFALQEAAYRTKDAQDALNKAIKEHGGSSDEAARATLQLNEALSAQAAAAGRAAADSSGLTDKMELQKVQAAGTLQALYQLRDQYGSAFPAALQQSIKRMEDAGVKLDWLGDKKPTPTVDLNTKPYDAASDNVFGDMANLASQHPTPTAGMNPAPFSSVLGTLSSSLGWLSSQHPTPLAGLNAAPFQYIASQTAGTLSWLNNYRANPAITAWVYGLSTADAQLNWAARPRYATIYTTVSQGSMRMVAGGGKVGDVVSGFAGGGKIRGPGGPVDDAIPAFADGGKPIRVSNLEWIVNAFAAARQGDAKMAALNAGQADIVPRDNSSAGSLAVSAGVTVGELHLHIDGSFDFTKPDTIRTLAERIRAALVALERERS